MAHFDLPSDELGSRHVASNIALDRLNSAICILL